MKLTDLSTEELFSGELIDDAGDRFNYGCPVLVLTPVDGGQKIRISRAQARFLCLVEATLDERSRLDRAGYCLPMDLFYKPSRRPRRR